MKRPSLRLALATVLITSLGACAVVPAAPYHDRDAVVVVDPSVVVPGLFFLGGWLVGRHHHGHHRGRGWRGGRRGHRH